MNADRPRQGDASFEHAAATALDAAVLAAHPLPPVAGDADKEVRGHVLVVAGSRQMPGAAVLAANAALRAGTGKLTIATSEQVAGALGLAVPEARVVALADTSRGGLVGSDGLALLAQEASAVLVGPGFLDEGASCALAAALVPGCAGHTLVLDALAMGGALAPLQGASTAHCVLTPHAGEMAHLTGWTKPEICAQPLAAARRAAAQWGVTVVLKGATTVIALPDGQAFVHEAAAPGLATSGSGDTLAGLLAGLAARGASPRTAALWAVALHARAGAQLAQRHGPLGFLAREIAPEVPALLARMGDPLAQ